MWHCQKPGLNGQKPLLCLLCDKNAFIYVDRSLTFNNIAGIETKQ